MSEWDLQYSMKGAEM